MAANESVRALYSFVSKAGMKFEAGQLINVLEKGEDGWWWGEVQNSESEGWFPASYVSPLLGQVLNISYFFLFPYWICRVQVEKVCLMYSI